MNCFFLFLNIFLPNPLFFGLTSLTYIGQSFPLWRPIYGHSGERLSSSYVYLPILHFEHNFLLNINTNLRFYTRCLLVCLKLLRKKSKIENASAHDTAQNINNYFIVPSLLSVYAGNSSSLHIQIFYLQSSHLISTPLLSR